MKIPRPRKGLRDAKKVLKYLGPVQTPPNFSSAEPD